MSDYWFCPAERPAHGPITPYRPAAILTARAHCAMLSSILSTTSIPAHSTSGALANSAGPLVYFPDTCPHIANMAEGRRRESGCCDAIPVSIASVKSLCIKPNPIQGLRALQFPPPSASAAAHDDGSPGQACDSPLVRSRIRPLVYL
ncbi:hypothetical protein PTT_05894 [Pyrenophora teres f. teres 0-1]|uniref:Uncharacterized protein n=1 Tax=Pyrenophora teres f. teres (strain 0-1) TaxID=861557 RepID=E3RF93_PYRTT|nr:hypothetical protein PTT_05894 [Pyrenophora teres f. teres 0-1]